MGENDLASIRFTQRELSTLRRAAEILEELREVRGNDDDDLGVDIALAGYTLREIVTNDVDAAPMHEMIS